jgi:chemotaxis protein methyltransferase CheR
VSQGRDQSYSLSNNDFNFICQYTYDLTGIVLSHKKREMVYRRLTRIIRERKLPTFTAYCDLLKSCPEQEQNYFINKITTNLTSFYRESHHFDYLVQEELPRLLNKGLHNDRLRIWSCASSTGEEPYSIAMSLMEALGPAILHSDVKILATDIDSNVLATADKGIYETRKMDELPIKFQQKYFHKGLGENINHVKVKHGLRQLITFKELNLLDEWPMKGLFDVIFCRNVIIYFDKPTQEQLFAHLHDILKPGGLLILGHSENLGTYQQYFENVGRTIFRKCTVKA